MKKFLNLLFVIGVFGGLMSCSENCSSFDMNNLSWTPYQEGDVIELYSQASDSTIEIFIKNVIVEHKTHVTFGSKCGYCGDDQIFISSSDDFAFNVEIYLNDGKIASQNYQISNSYFSDYTEIKNYLLENAEYDLVRVFENGGSNGEFKKLIIAKNVGIVGLIDIRDNYWILKPELKLRKSNEQNDQKKIVINSMIKSLNEGIIKEKYNQFLEKLNFAKEDGFVNVLYPAIKNCNDIEGAILCGFEINQDNFIEKLKKETKNKRGVEIDGEIFNEIE